MKQIFQQWLVRNTKAPGVLAFGVQYPDKTSVTQPCGPNIPAEALDNAWRGVTETIPVLQLNRFPTARVRWVYQQGMVQCERRQDGVCLGIFTSRDPNLIASKEVERLLSEFHAL